MRAKGEGYLRRKQEPAQDPLVRGCRMLCQGGSEARSKGLLPGELLLHGPAARIQAQGPGWVPGAVYPQHLGGTQALLLYQEDTTKRKPSSGHHNISALPEALCPPSQDLAAVRERSNMHILSFLLNDHTTGFTADF